MTINTQNLSEDDTRAKLIDPDLDAMGWNSFPAVLRRAVAITQGRLIGGQKRARPKVADYILTYRGQKLAVLEAKKSSLGATEGRTQAIDYAQRLNIRFALCSNGHQIYQIDLKTGLEGYIDTYPTPKALWDKTFEIQNGWRDLFAATPYYNSDGRIIRPYQENAVDAVLNTVADGKDRILLTLATGTGKTMIAQQIAYKLYQARYTLKQDKARHPRILFLADRNILANQAFNSFSAFPEDARCRISPEQMRKDGKAPKNAHVFFTIFQTFMTDDAEQQPIFYDYAPDFFDFIIIDECHRGGANDESSWRSILEYFKPAIQLGLTATPKRTINADSYAYFNDPVYVYSLKDGIDDGYLTPYKIEKYESNIDDYEHCVDDDIIEGDIDPDKIYTEKDFNRDLIIPEREKYRVQQFFSKIKPYEKGIVFCATQDHAAMVRDFINQMKPDTDPNYAARVTANDGKEGETFLEHFQNDEKSIPTFLTTSRKLSTGVDAPEVKHVILMRPVKSMIEFKQIIGRGTRLANGKDYFTIHDFVGAINLFSDPDWDGDPLPPDEPKDKKIKNDQDDKNPTEPELNQPDNETEEGANQPKQKIIIQLSNGRKNSLECTSQAFFTDKDGKPVPANEYMQQFYKDLPPICLDDAELRKIWSLPETRTALIDEFRERGYYLGALQKFIKAEKSDIYDMLVHIAHDRPLILRQKRSEIALDLIKKEYDPQMIDFISFVLQQYIDTGIKALNVDQISDMLTLKYHSLTDAKQALGDTSAIQNAFIGFQKHLYSENCL